MDINPDEVDWNRYYTNVSVSQAVSQNLISCTTAYLDTNNLSEGLGSGTFVTIEDRVFLATCSHTIPGRPQGRISFITRQSENIGESIFELLGFAKAEGPPDVAYLELSPDDVAKIGKQSITLDRVRPRGVGEANRIAFVSGFPSELIEQRKYVNEGVKTLESGFNMFCYPSPPLQPNEWPTPPKDSEPTDEIVDLFLPYDQNAPVIKLSEKGPNGLVHPMGSSGGGWWQGEETGGKIWSTEVVRLFGIQSSFYEPGKYIRVVQIHHWLRLLYKHETKLRKTLRKAFGDLFK